MEWCDCWHGCGYSGTDAGEGLGVICLCDFGVAAEEHLVLNFIGSKCGVCCWFLTDKKLPYFGDYMGVGYDRVWCAYVTRSVGCFNISHVGWVLTWPYEMLSMLCTIG